MTSKGNSRKRAQSKEDALGLVRRSLRRRPPMPDIVTFATSPEYLGLTLYPLQKAWLKLVYGLIDLLTPYERRAVECWARDFPTGTKRWGISPDVYARLKWLKEHGRPHFSHVVLIGGRRGSKGFLGAILIAYETYRLLWLGDPQAHYGLARGHHIRIYVTAVTRQQAQEAQFAEAFNIIMGAPCFRDRVVTARKGFLSLMTEADERRFAALGRRDRKLRAEFASIRISAIAANAPAARGAACAMIVFDEFAHVQEGTGGPATADQAYQALVPSLAQMHGDGLVFVATSPYSKMGRAYRLYQEGLALDERTGEPQSPDFLTCQFPSWGLYQGWDDPEATGGEPLPVPPVVHDEEEFGRERARDREAFEVEFEAQWRDVEGSYFDPGAVDRMFAPFCPRCGTPLPEEPECPRCHEPPRHLEERGHGIPHWNYRGHGDPGENRSNYGMVILHSEWFEDEVGDPDAHVILDLARAWRPEDYPDGQIPFRSVNREIVDIVLRFGTLEVFTFDQFSAPGTVEPTRVALRNRRHPARVWKEPFSEPANLRRADVLRQALADGRVHAYRDQLGPDGQSLLEAELKTLRRQGNKMVKASIGPVRSKDLVDCLLVAAEGVLAEELERGAIVRRLGESRPSFGARGGYGTNYQPREVSRSRAALERFGAYRAANRGINPAQWPGLRDRLGPRRSLPGDIKRYRGLF